jgi:hypothetical protein
MLGYRNMAGMIFGPVPAFDDVIGSIHTLEEYLREARDV